MKFAMLCSGSKGNCFLLQDENTQIVIDCGKNKRYLQDCFKKLNTSLADIDAVLITHTHSDHISSIHYFSEKPIYCAGEIKDVKIIPVVPDNAFNIGHLTIMPIALSHDCPHTVGYVIQSAFEKLVYITDTGYVANRYLPLLEGADYIVLESNHDVTLLMQSNRPMFLKQRIASDNGHLCNEDCAAILDKIVTNKTKWIILAHLSEECNTREKALEVTKAMLQKHNNKRDGLILVASGQFEMIQKGEKEHEKENYGSCYSIVGMESCS